MKNLLFLILLFPVLLAAQIQTQFSAVADFGTFTAVNDSIWRGDITNWSDPLTMSYLPSGIVVGYGLIDAGGKLYRVKVINSTTFSSANLDIVELQNSTAPTGKGSVFDFLANGMIPPAVANSAGITPVVRSRIDIHNSKIAQNAGSPTVSIKAQISDTTTITGAKQGDIVLIGTSLYDTTLIRTAFGWAIETGYPQSLITVSDATILAGIVYTQLLAHQVVNISTALPSSAAADRGVQLPSVETMLFSDIFKIVTVSAKDSSASFKLFVSSAGFEELSVNGLRVQSYDLAPQETASFQLVRFGSVYEWRLIHTSVFATGGGGAPSGSAGGGLTGTYPNPTIAANAVNSSSIADNSIVNNDVLDNSIKTIKIVKDTIYMAISGQSNAIGRPDTSLTAGVVAWDSTTNARVFVWNGTTATMQVATYANTHDTQYTNYGVPVNNGAWQAAKRLQERTGKIVCLVVSALGNQAISYWLNGTFPASGTGYTRLKTAITNAGFPRLDYFIWDQGEGDEGINANYAGSFDTLIRSLRAETFFDKETPIAITGMPQTVAVSRPWNQKFIDIGYGSNPYVTFANTDSIQLITNDPQAGGIGSAPIHFSGVGLDALGARYANAFITAPRNGNVPMLRQLNGWVGIGPTAQNPKTGLDSGVPFSRASTGAIQEIRQYFGMAGSQAGASHTDTAVFVVYLPSTVGTAQLNLAFSGTTVSTHITSNSRLSISINAGQAVSVAFDGAIARSNLKPIVRVGTVNAGATIAVIIGGDSTTWGFATAVLDRLSSGQGATLGLDTVTVRCVRTKASIASLIAGISAIYTVGTDYSGFSYQNGNITSDRLNKTINSVFTQNDATAYTTVGGTGSVKITLPTKLNTEAGSVYMRIVGNDRYYGNFSVIVHGFWNGTSLGWASAQIFGKFPNGSVRIAAGVQGTTPVIVLGTTTSVWAYMQVSIEKIWGSAFTGATTTDFASTTIALITSETGLTLSTLSPTNTLQAAYVEVVDAGTLITATDAEAAFQEIFGLVRSGAGSPEGVVTATVGKIYLRNNGASGSTLYIKETGSGNTGWVAVVQPLLPISISLNNADYAVPIGFISGLNVALETSSGATSDSQLQLPTASSTQEGKVIYLTSFDTDVTNMVTISGGTDELYYLGSFSNSVILAAGDVRQIICVKRGSDNAYKWAIK